MVRSTIEVRYKKGFNHIFGESNSPQAVFSI